MTQCLRKVGIFCFALVLSCTLLAQYTKANDDPDASFKLAKELYQKEQFSLAYPLFKALYAENKSNSSIPVSIQTESKFYSIICGLALKDETAEKAAIEFIDFKHKKPLLLTCVCFV